MNILLTGGAGFIGSHVAEAYLSLGHRVIIVDNLTTGKRKNIPADAIFYETDVRDRKKIEAIFAKERIDAINHHAAQMKAPVSVKNPVYDAEVNLIGLLQIMECATKYRVKKVISISSAAVFGDVGDDPIRHDAPKNPISPYGIHKYTTELYLAYYMKQRGIPYTILRYANVYGPRQVGDGEGGVVAIFTGTMLRGESPTVFSYPEEPDGMIRDYIYVRDLMSANISALEQGDGQIINLGTEVGIKTTELARTIRAEIDADIPIKYGSARTGDIRVSVFDSENARRHLNWRPKTRLTDGIRETVAYYRGQE